MYRAYIVTSEKVYDELGFKRCRPFVRFFFGLSDNVVFFFFDVQRDIGSLISFFFFASSSGTTSRGT